MRFLEFMDRNIDILSIVFLITLIISLLFGATYYDQRHTHKTTCECREVRK